MIDWHPVRLAVFDVDGTLYDQRALRRRMASLLIGQCLAERSLRTLRTLKTYRELRERRASPSDGFSEAHLIAAVAEAMGRPEAEVATTVSEWIHRRPLLLLKQLRYRDVAELFQLIRRSGRLIGVLSDHPAREKLRALELDADHVMAADDDDVKALKPNPRGLNLLMERSQVSPTSTIMVGDRPERDGEMGRRAHVPTYIRSERPKKGWTCFASFAQLAVGLSDPTSG